jgi:hypothetical protein
VRRVLLVLAAACCALGGCGLEQWPYLEPPGTIEAGPIDPLFRIINVPTTVTEFRGFEAYYKFYSRDQAKEIGITTREGLVASGFRRVCSDTGSVASQVPPLVLVDALDRGDAFTTTAYFDAPDTAAYASYGGANPPSGDPNIPIRRAVEEFGVPKEFKRDSFVETDADLSAIWDDVQAQGKELHLVMYALSYGLKELTDPLYSTATYLGYMIYYLP